jgi:hypothetical protein
MATKGYLDSLINGLPVEYRYPLRSAFWYLMDNWRLGSGPRAENAQLYRYTSTSASVANTEWSVAHGLGVAPTNLIPIVDLKSVGSQLIPLTVSRAPDAERIYLKSTSTSAVLCFYLEA